MDSERVWTNEENFAPTSIWFRNFQHLASGCTDWAIPALTEVCSGQEGEQIEGPQDGMPVTDQFQG